MNINKQKLVLLPVLILAALALSLFCPGGLASRPSSPGPEAAGSGLLEREEDRALQANLNRLKAELEEQASAGPSELSLSMYDFATGEWIELNAGKPFYPASLIKTLLLITALEQANRGVLSLEDSYLLTAADKLAGETPVTGTGILQFAEEGSVYMVEELLALMVSLSDNVASNIVLDLVGAESVEAMARRLGLENTRATRKMYDLHSPQPSNVSTARDLTRMLIALEEGAVCGRELSQKGIAMMLRTDNKQRIARYVKPRQAAVANKIGTVSRVIGDMALLYFPDRPPVALTILVGDPADPQEAEKEIGRLAAAVVKTLGKG